MNKNMEEFDQWIFKTFNDYWQSPELITKYVNHFLGMVEMLTDLPFTDLSDEAKKVADEI